MISPPRLAGWQHSSNSSFGSLHLDQQPEAAAAATAADAPDIDPWSSGLELVAAAPTAAGDPVTAPFPLTDAGLEALLAPFEDWPYLLQPAGSAAQAMPTTLLHAPAACAGTQPPPQQHQHQSCAAAAQSPRSSNGSGSAPAGCCTCACGAAAAAAGTAAAVTATAPKSASAKQATRRRGGRPRVSHHRDAAAAAGGGASDGGSASAAAGAPPPAGQPFKKSGRGPKPKYVFSTQEEAADARRERNRKAALESYYR